MEEVTVVKLDTSKAINSLKSLRTELKNVKDAIKIIKDEKSQGNSITD